MPPDNIGNCLDLNSNTYSVPDNIGNSIEPVSIRHFDREFFKKRNKQNNLKNNRYLADGINPIINNKSNESPYRRNSEISEFNKKTNQIQTEKRLRKLFEFENDDFSEYVLTSTPEEKQKQIEQVLKKILNVKPNSRAKIAINIENNDGKPSLVVKIKTHLFKNNDLSFSALVFLVNKILNRNRLDRIRILLEVV